jgi:glycine oxidase
VKSFDAVIIGGGIIGLALALELRKRDWTVLVLDRGQPGHEASSAGAGMLAAAEVEGPDSLRALAHLSAGLYPEFISQAKALSGSDIDFNESGAICLSRGPALHAPILLEQLRTLEPALAATSLNASFSAESFVEPRSLVAALMAWAKREGVTVYGGSEVLAVPLANGAATGVTTQQTAFHAGVVVNCAGAWAGAVSPVPIPVRPVKGHMLNLLPACSPAIRHVIRDHDRDVYLVPRRDGRISVGSTVEEAGFNKEVDPATIQRLHQAAADLVPALGEARIHEAWTGLRPGTPDSLPIMGATSIKNYFVSTGHYRNGILLAPVCAQVMSELIRGRDVVFDLSAFSPDRFVRQV